MTSNPSTVTPVSPELTIVHAAEQREALLQTVQTHAGDITLDLSGVTEFDSAGVQLLISMRASLKARDCELSLPSPSAAVMDVLRIYGLEALAHGTLGGAA